MFYEDPLESARAEFSDDDREAASAMLAACSHRMTGREIEVCDAIASTANDDFEEFSLNGDDLRWFRSLTIQFAREIGAWKDGVAVA